MYFGIHTMAIPSTPTTLIVHETGRLETVHYWKFTLYRSSNNGNLYLILVCLLHSCWNFYKRFGDCLRWWLVSVFVTLHSAKYWMKAPKLVKTKKSQLKVPVTTAGRKMQFFRNSNSSGPKWQIQIPVTTAGNHQTFFRNSNRRGNTSTPSWIF